MVKARPNQWDQCAQGGQSMITLPSYCFHASLIVLIVSDDAYSIPFSSLLPFDIYCYCSYDFTLSLLCVCAFLTTMLLYFHCCTCLVLSWEHGACVTSFAIAQIIYLALILTNVLDRIIKEGFYNN